MTRPDRGDYATCDCARAQELAGVGTCGGCEEYEAAVDQWADQVEAQRGAADALRDLMKDEDIRRG